MSEYFNIHPENPQPRFIHRAVALFREGAVVVYPTDSAYALGCRVGEKAALDRIRQIRRLDVRHNFTLLCRDLREAGTYAKFDDPQFRLLRAHTPGPYTYVLRATKEVPRRMLHPKRKTIGMRIPNHPIVRALLDELNEALISTTLMRPGDEYPLNDPEEIRARLSAHVDLIIDGGPVGTIPSTVVDLTDSVPRVLREGKGDPSPFL